MDPELHPDLEPLKFLLGTWEGAGVGGYPTIESFNFGQEISFTHIGKPFLIYSSRSWMIEEDGTLGRPLGMETGYWRPLPDHGVEVTLAHPTGIVEIYAGNVAFSRVELKTDVVIHTESAKDVQSGHRMYGMIGEDLGWVYDMAALGHKLQSHLSAQLKRVG